VKWPLFEARARLSVGQPNKQISETVSHLQYFNQYMVQFMVNSLLFLVIPE